MTPEETSEAKKRLGLVGNWDNNWWIPDTTKISYLKEGIQKKIRREGFVIDAVEEYTQKLSS